ncbi:MAG: M10 family metallopeptidase [Hyphomicrobium sp.]|nr:M10 family metallopeptidase [Hyphomicrobium sp.]
MPTVVNLSGNRDIDGILWGYKWDFTTLTYSFPQNVFGWQYSQGIFEFEAFNATQINAAIRAMRNIDNVCGLNFTQAPNPADGNIRWGEATQINYLNQGGIGWHAPGFNAQNPSAEANPPDPAFPAYTQGDLWFSKGNYNSPQIGGFAYAAGIMHELGHAAGLKHGHQTSTSHGQNFPTLPPNHDSQEYSVMTYNNSPGRIASGNLNLDYPTTFMQNDIAALQYMYGANYAFNASATTYSWSPTTGETFINGVSQGRPFHNKIFLTIWDGGGVDTYNFSNYTTVVVVNLNPGQWSTPSSAQKANLGDGIFARGSIANALLHKNDGRSLIENANGGSNNDVIVGNVARNTLNGNNGNDQLFGGVGNDTLSGGAGADTLAGGTGLDRLTGGAGNDTFLFNAAVSSTSRDALTDFNVPQDQFKIDNAFFSVTGAVNTILSADQFHRGTAAHDGTDRIIYNPANGQLIYDSNGTGAGGAVVFATTGLNLSITRADFIIV